MTAEPDVVYMVRAANRFHELALSLRSLRHVPHGNVWIFGAAPSWLTGAIHVPVRQGRVKHENTAKITAAIARNIGVSKQFYWFHDDMYVLRPLERIPRLNRGPWAAWAPLAPQKAPYTEALLSAFGKPCHTAYELHVPMLVDRAALAELVEAVTTYDPDALVKAAKRSLYGNWVGYGGEPIEDVKFRSVRDMLAPGSLFASTSDHAIRSGPGRAVLRMLPDPAPYEQWDAFGPAPGRRAMRQRA